MNNIVIRVEKISKIYNLGELHKHSNSFRDRVTGLVKSIRKKSKVESIWALKNVSFQIKEGEVIGIIGRNGAGKTTILKILSRITKPTMGYAEISGRVGSLLEIGTGFHHELTGRENIYLNGAILGMKKSEIKRKFDEIVSFAEIERFIDTPVKRYSSGMFVRLAFSVAAHLEPEILLVDEVLAVGDIAFQKKCLGKMDDVARKGRTVVFISHNMGTIKSLCKSAIMLENGKKVCEGSVDKVVNSYLQSILNDDTSGELLPDRHQFNSGQIWIKQIILLNAQGKAVKQICMGEALNIIVKFEVLQPIKNVRIGIGLDTLDGVRIATLHHTDNGSLLFSGDCGSYKVTLKIKNLLTSGTYILTVGAHQAIGGIPLDYIPNALKFDILDVSLSQQQHKAHNKGLVKFEGEWMSILKI